MQKRDVVRDGLAVGESGAAAGPAAVSASSTARNSIPVPSRSAREARGQIAALAVDQRARGEGESGVQSATMPALASRALLRRGTIIGTAADPGQHAGEKPDHEADAVRADQQGAVARPGAIRDPPREMPPSGRPVRRR